MFDSKWSTDSFIGGWLGQDIVKINILKNGLIWDTHYYVPCLGRMYSNAGSARKAIAMHIKRGGC